MAKVVASPPSKVIAYVHVPTPHQTTESPVLSVTLKSGPGQERPPETQWHPPDSHGQHSGKPEQLFAAVVAKPASRLTRSQAQEKIAAVG